MFARATDGQLSEHCVPIPLCRTDQTMQGNGCRDIHDVHAAIVFLHLLSLVLQRAELRELFGAPYFVLGRRRCRRYSHGFVSIAWLPTPCHQR